MLALMPVGQSFRWLFRWEFRHCFYRFTVVVDFPDAVLSHIVWDQKPDSIVRKSSERTSFLSNLISSTRSAEPVEGDIFQRVICILLGSSAHKESKELN